MVLKGAKTGRSIVQCMKETKERFDKLRDDTEYPNASDDTFLNMLLDAGDYFMNEEDNTSNDARETLDKPEHHKQTVIKEVLDY